MAVIMGVSGTCASISFWRRATVGSKRVWVPDAAMPVIVLFILFNP